MTVDTWLTFAVLELLLCLTPGPAVLFVTTTAADRGAGAATIATTGILISNLMYFIISGTGVAAILLASPTLFVALRWGGSAYLLYLGARMIVAVMPGNGEPQAVAAPVQQKHISLLQGFMVQTLNPKAIAFFAALLPQFVSTAAPIVPQMVILTLTSVAVEASVMALYIWLTLSFGKQSGARERTWFKRIGGAFLILAALRMAINS